MIRKPKRSGQARGPFERLMFTFMGPPQLGDPDEPPAAPRAVACGDCGQPLDQHEIARSDRVTSIRCPAADAGA